jgi:hypothetical protein
VQKEFTALTRLQKEFAALTRLRKEYPAFTFQILTFLKKHLNHVKDFILNILPL